MYSVRKWACTSVVNLLNYIHQDTKSAWLIAMCKRTFRLSFVYQIKIIAAYILFITYQIILILIWLPQCNQITGEESSHKAK